MGAKNTSQEHVAPGSKEHTKYKLVEQVNGYQRFAERWTAVPDDLLDNVDKLGLNSTQLAIVIAIKKFTWDRREVYPSHDTIAQMAGCKKRAVARNIFLLEQKGLLRVRRGPKNKVNHYSLAPLWNELARILRIEPPLQDGTVSRKPKIGPVLINNEPEERQYASYKDWLWGEPLPDTLPEPSDESSYRGVSDMEDEWEDFPL